MGQHSLNDEELRELAGADEATVLTLLQKEFERSLAEFPEYAEMLEDIDASVCRRLDLIEAMRTAPNSQVRQYLLGVYHVRQSFNLVAGRSFS